MKVLDFGAVPPTKRPAIPAEPCSLFEAAHPAQASAEAAAWALAEAGQVVDKPRIARYVAKLLPVSQGSLEELGNRNLAKGGQLCLEVSALTSQVTDVGAPAILAEVVAQLKPPSWLAKLRPAPKPTELVRRVTALRQLLLPLQVDAKHWKGELEPVVLGLQTCLVALRGVLQVAGTPPSDLERIAHQRETQLVAGLQQARIGVAQADQLIQLLTGLVSQCDRMVQTTIPAASLTKALADR